MNPMQTSTIRSSCFLAAALLGVVPPFSTAQAGSAGQTLQPGGNVVTIPVIVRDKKGQLVPNLTKDDFVLQEDGKPQTINYFGPDAGQPLTVGLLIDTSPGQRNALDPERTASGKFFDQMLSGPKDQAFLVHFDREVELLQDVTSSREKLQKGLGLLDTPEPQYAEQGGGGSQGGHQAARGDTLLYDSVFLAADELMRKQSGRKAVVVFSNGVDHGSKETLQSAIEAAQRFLTPVYAIYVKGEENRNSNLNNPGNQRPGGWPGPGGGGWPGGGAGWPGGGRRGTAPTPPQQPHIDGRKILEQIAGETGGRMFEVSKKQPVEQIYAEIEQDLRSQSSLGFTPIGDAASEGFHPIDVRAKKKDYYVQAQDGFYALTPAKSSGGQ